jgi:protein-S-isoprenylcysteine O-methyltransferase Ste14
VTTDVSRPPSATRFGLCLVALSVALGLLCLQHWVANAPLISCAGIVLVIGVAEWLRPRWRNPLATALAPRALRPLNLRRVAVRLVGLGATLGLVAVAYCLFPEYGGTFYQPYWQFLRTLAPLGIAIPFYFAWTDTHATDAQDEYLEFGSFVLGGWHAANRRVLQRHLLGWTVKAFFLPLMVGYLGEEVRLVYRAWQGLGPQVFNVYQVCYHLTYAVDLLFCVVGYTTTIRLFDSQIRSVEPTVAGWVVALICYQPFYSVIGKYYLAYDDDIFWDNWLQPWPMIRGGWGAAIIVLSSIYALSTVAFGLRFSNLTHRGIITAGPYRYSKHPAYLCKNLSWWLISVPFIGHDGWSALRNCCLLGLINLVYFFRARTEERHLSHDPTYVQYALWMNDHGLLRPLARMFPFLRYRAPVSQAASQAAS